jgi:hypothetical protein
MPDAEAEVLCPDNTKVTGGVFEVQPTGQPINVKENKPVDNGWKVIIEYVVTLEGTLTVYAQCGELVNP